MRELGVFRGKRKDTGKWAEGNYVCLNGVGDMENLHLIIDSHGEYHTIDPETVGEYTGLVDQNGTKIFEGDDIIYTPVDQNSIQIFEEDDIINIPKDEIKTIRWTTYKSAFEAVSEVDVVGLDIFSPDEIKIIGNIYDHPQSYKEAEE